MTDKEAYKAIGERAEELSKRADVQKKMVEIAVKDGKAEAEKWLYMSAIASLMNQDDIFALFRLQFCPMWVIMVISVIMPV